MNYWLVKQEPESYAWEQLVKEKRTCWDGVRNFQARKNLRAMKKGDAVLFYHSGAMKAVVGRCEVVREGYPDPTAKQGDWTAVDLAARETYPHAVTLAQIRQQKGLEEIALVRQSRLSVMPLKKGEFERIEKMARKG